MSEVCDCSATQGDKNSVDVEDGPLLQGMERRDAAANNTEKRKNVENVPMHDYDDSREKGVDYDNYDPHMHRDVDKPTTNMETLTNLLKGCLGTGILAMPEAFRNCGLVNGIISTVIIGILCTYGIHILIRCEYLICKKLKIPFLSYPQTMKTALEMGPNCLRCFAKSSPIVVDIFLIVYQLGIGCVYILFVGRNMKDVIDYFTGSGSSSSDPIEQADPKAGISIELVLLGLLVPFILINLIKNLKILAPFSTLANLFTFVSFGIVMYYVLQGLPPITERPAFGEPLKYPLFFGTTLFALEAAGVVIAVEQNMKEPKKFGGYFGVFNIAMFVVVLLYVGMGIIGYWRYGDEIFASITLNLPPNSGFTIAVKVLYSLAIYISFALQMYVAIEILWKSYIRPRLEDSNHLAVWEFGLRIVSVIVTGVLAIAIPLLGLFISLFGAFCLSALGFIFPCVIELCVFWEKGVGNIKSVLVRDTFMIIFGFIGLFVGSTITILEIITELSKDKK